MVQRAVQLTIGLAAMVLASAGASAPAVTVSDLEPFSHVAFVPAGADISSIRLEQVKLVNVATRIRSVNGSWNQTMFKTRSAPADYIMVRVNSPSSMSTRR